MMPDADMVPPDMRLELQKFHEAAEQLIDLFFKSIEVPCPLIIYHYTNDVGLRGILETGKAGHRLGPLHRDLERSWRRREDYGE